MLQNITTMYVYEKYGHVFPGTNIHWVTCIIIFFESAMFVYQLIRYVAMPSGKAQLWYLILLAAFIQYNILGSIFTGPAITSIPLYVQGIIEVSGWAAVILYFLIYIYKGLGITELRFFVNKGTLVFPVIPVIFVFTPIYLLSGNSERAITYLVFSLVGLVLFYLYKVWGVWIKVLRYPGRGRVFNEKLFAATLSLFLLAIGAIVVHISGTGQPAGHVLSNIGVIVMTVVFAKSLALELLEKHTDLQNRNTLLEQKVRERTTRLELTFNRKAALFTGLRHEIRTPLTLTNCNLQQHVVVHGTSLHLDAVRKSTDELMARIDHFFEEKIFPDTQLIYLHDQVTDFSQLVSYNISLFSGYAVQKNITVTARIEPDIYILADPNSLDSIVNNLVENAIRNTPASGVIWMALDAEGDNIYFSVRDSGCGISADMQKKISDPYARANLAGNSPGLGMGLPIVESCVKSLAGNITLHSDVNQGCAFLVKLPRHKGQAAITGMDATDTADTAGIIAPVITPIPVSTATGATGAMACLETPCDALLHGRKPFIMVVEGHMGQLLHLRDVLKADYNVYVACNGQEALGKIKTIPRLDLVILDMLMDNMDGIQLLRALLDDPLCRLIPFLFLTTSATLQNKETCYEQGAVDYVQKPVDTAILLMKVKAIVENYRIQQITGKISDDLVNDLKLNNLYTDWAGIKLKGEQLDANCRQYGITDREKEIILLLEGSGTLDEIAGQLRISPKAIRKHCKSIYHKVNVSNKPEMLRKLFGDSGSS
jgi:signal transduction histidine kinase/DNA-binding NarL/FixJ family response regulator